MGKSRDTEGAGEGAVMSGLLAHERDTAQARNRGRKKVSNGGG